MKKYVTHEEFEKKLQKIGMKLTQLEKYIRENIIGHNQVQEILIPIDES